ncbi:hypothetical protein NPIL_375791 [Nephila pilipes]|uniref:Uncharacterized protein n=1 Tax=Nephila pilipes TaxID=299642 RepID=A0A8X6T7W4_NEPPI|nr:hypothetical protein NPIL_375791 [Nephila pilipes]
MSPYLLTASPRDIQSLFFFGASKDNHHARTSLARPNCLSSRGQTNSSHCLHMRSAFTCSRLISDESFLHCLFKQKDFARANWESVRDMTRAIDTFPPRS